MPPKRKSSTTAATGVAKKPNTDADHAHAATLVKAILADPDDFSVPDDDDETRKNFIALAKYAHDLQGRIAVQVQANAAAPVKKSPKELEEAAEKIRRAAVAGIKKQMNWRPTCKIGSAKWCYDGICPDPDVFGALLGLGGPPSFKMKKMPKEEFETHLGSIEASARYSDLFITGEHVNIRWSETGEFKFSGTYGTHRPSID